MLGKSICQKRTTHPFVPIPEGSFMREGVEASLSPFYMAQFAVTQELYEAVMGTKHSHFRGLQNPVEQVSWYDSIEFCIALNKLLGIYKPFYILDKTTKDTNNKDEKDKFRCVGLFFLTNFTAN
jgi:formylglycine-generating enzyme required for sulfatase activity